RTSKSWLSPPGGGTSSSRRYPLPAPPTDRFLEPVEDVAMSGENPCPFSRRAFLSGVAGGAAAALASPCLPEAAAAPAAAARPSADELARTMPGPFPGRVIEVAHRGSVVN